MIKGVVMHMLRQQVIQTIRQEQHIELEHVDDVNENVEHCSSCSSCSSWVEHFSQVGLSSS